MALGILNEWLAKIFVSDNYYRFQYNRFGAFLGINAADFRMYPFGRGIHLDLRLCTIPTVGFYRS